MKIDAPPGKTPIVLYLHCDTAAPWNFQRRWDLSEQPYAVRMAILLYSHGTGMTRTNSWVLQVPKDAYFDRGAVARHGITREVCESKGVDPRMAISRVEQVMSMLESGADTAPGYCAYGPDWHTRVLKSTARRAGHPGDAALWRVCDGDWWCAMRAATPVLALPGKRGKGLRFPTLQAAYAHFLGGSLPETSDPVASGQLLVQAVHEIDVATDGVMAAAARIEN